MTQLNASVPRDSLARRRQVLTSGASHVKKTSIKTKWVKSHAQIAWPTLTLPKTRQAQPDPTIASAILGSSALERLNARPAQPDFNAPMGHHLNASEASRQWRHSQCVRHV
jgi:hypothetical protein